MDVKSWLGSHRLKLGTILTLDHVAVIEIARLAGFDWLWIDAEHGSFNEQSASVACVVSGGGPPVFVRLPDRSATAIKRYLETGCDGIILPQVSSLDDVNEIARAALYPPRGERSIGIARAQGYGMRFADYLQSRSYAIIAQIETATGVANAQAILEHNAIDAVIIGPYDLSGSLGIPGEIESPRVVESIASVFALARKTGKPCGIFAATPEKAKTYASAGFEWISVGMDITVLLDAYKSIRESFPS
jgi:2-keto-3-deoxy-L-rhamnonate aldolase RhmA